MTDTCPRCGVHRGHHRCAACDAEDRAAREARGLEPPEDRGPAPCPYCGAKVGEHCTTPSGGTVRAHRARVVLSVVGAKSASAVEAVQKILDENTRRQVALAAKKDR